MFGFAVLLGRKASIQVAGIPSSSQQNRVLEMNVPNCEVRLGSGHI